MAELKEVRVNSSENGQIGDTKPSSNGNDTEASPNTSLLNEAKVNSGGSESVVVVTQPDSAPMTTQEEPAPEEPPNYNFILGFSIFTIFCCCCLGIPATVFAVMAKQNEGTEESKRHLKKAFTLAKAACAVTCCIMLLYLIITFFASL